MKLLALEFSTDAGSLALLNDGVVSAAMPLDAGGRRSQALFEVAAKWLAGQGGTLADVDAFAVGRGPGSYTGLRVSLTAARGWALPGNKPVWAISSGAALAAEQFALRPDWNSAAVWGDARRDMIWAGRFERGEGIGVRQTEAWRLMPAAAHGTAWPDAGWVAEGLRPSAEWVGRLFFTGIPSEELQPVYLNPAVAIAPRFDAEGKPV